MSFVTVIFNNSTSYPFDNTVIDQIPYLKKKCENLTEKKLEVHIPYAVKYRHVAAVAKLILKRAIIPSIDATSHEDVLLVVQLAKYMGISESTLADGFVGWTVDAKWIHLHNPEMMWTLHCELEESVDFRKFFRLHKDPFNVVAKMIAQTTNNIHEKIKIISFFKNYDFTTCFDMNNDKVHAMIVTLNNLRDRIGDSLLIRPHEYEDVATYFAYDDLSIDKKLVWACQGISALAKPQYGENTIASLEVFKKRFFDFTFGLIEKSINTDLSDSTFPYDDVIFAGGAITKLIASEYSPKNARQSDCDIFVLGKTLEERTKNFNKVLKWFESQTKNVTYYAIRGSVATVYIKNVARKFQIISMDKSSAFEILAHFDVTHIQWGYYQGNIICTPDACNSLKTKTTRFNNTSRIKVARLIKALHCGYDIVISEKLVDDHTDITELISNKESPTLQKLIRDLYGWYYPMTMPDMDEDEEKQHILCQIEKDAEASLVTVDINYVLDNITVSGDFNQGYLSHSFENFNIAEIKHEAHGRRIRKAYVRSKFGTMRLTTSLLTVTNIVNTAEGIEITAMCSDNKFIEFCTMLETTVYRLYKREPVSKHILDNNLLRFTIAQYRIDNQLQKGVSLLKNQRGQALNIEEDLAVGDTFQVLFSMEIIMTDDDRSITLIPTKFVKFQPVMPHVEPEVIPTMEAVDFNGEIEYVDACDI